MEILANAGLPTEGREKVDTALSLGDASPESRRAAHEAAGGLAYWQADMSAAEEHYRLALELARESGNPAEMPTPSTTYRHRGPPGLASAMPLSLLDEGLALAEDLGDPVLIGRIHWGKGGVHYLTEKPHGGKSRGARSPSIGWRPSTWVRPGRSSTSVGPNECWRPC